MGSITVFKESFSLQCLYRVKHKPQPLEDVRHGGGGLEPVTLRSSAGLYQMQQEAGKPQEFTWTTFSSLPVESDTALIISRAGDRYRHCHPEQ